MKFFKAISNLVGLAILFSALTASVSFLSPAAPLFNALSLFHYAVLFGLIIVAAGRKVVVSGAGGVLIACFAGPVIVFLDTVIVNGIGGFYQPEYQRQLAEMDPTRAEEARAIWLALIITTFLMLFPISMAFSALGGVFGKRALKRAHNAS